MSRTYIDTSITCYLHVLRRQIFAIYLEFFEGKKRGMTKGRVTNRRVISESYDFGELCSNHAQTAPTFPNDHSQFRNSPDVSLN
jgi:hypothetical protein